jgi:hypothetical protein
MPPLSYALSAGIGPCHVLLPSKPRCVRGQTRVRSWVAVGVVRGMA